MPIPSVGACFATSAEFIDYLESIKFGAWRPRFVTMHHTGAPDLKTWQGWQTRAKPVSDEQWLHNLADYYAKPVPGVKGVWDRGPHFFFTPKHFCVLSPPDRRGIHAASFNSVSWGVECVGNFDVEPFEGDVRDRYIEGLAALHIASGLQLMPFEKGVRGLHFHRDDPQTRKLCPGKRIDKTNLINAVLAKIANMTGGEHVAEEVTEPTRDRKRRGVVSTDGLNVRAAASGKAPVVATLNAGADVVIEGEALNGTTKWFDVGPGWVAARYVTAEA